MAKHTLGHGMTPHKIALQVISAPGKVTENWTFSELENAVLRHANALKNGA